MKSYEYRPPPDLSVNNIIIDTVYFVNKKSWRGNALHLPNRYWSEGTTWAYQGGQKKTWPKQPRWEIRQEIWGWQGTTYFVGCIKGLQKWTKPRGSTGCIVICKQCTRLCANKYWLDLSSVLAFSLLLRQVTQRLCRRNQAGTWSFSEGNSPL